MTKFKKYITQSYKVIMILTIIFLLSSCVSFVTESHLGLSKGSSYAEFQKAGVEFEEEIQLKNPELTSKGNFRLFYAEMPSAFQEEYYFYAFKNDKLLYWGHPFMFLRHIDNEIRLIGEEGSDYVIKNID